MLKPLMLFTIGLFFGTGIGVVLGATSGVTLAGHDHGDPAQHSGYATPMAHAAGDMLEHALLDVSGEDVRPILALRLHPDTGGTQNLEIVTENFAFAPEDVNKAHVPGEGHAHVYIDGVKVARAYSPWLYLADLPPGAEIRVTLNANTHETLAIGDMPIAAIVHAPAS